MLEVTVCSYASQADLWVDKVTHKFDARSAGEK